MVNLEQMLNLRRNAKFLQIGKLICNLHRRTSSRHGNRTVFPQDDAIAPWKSHHFSHRTTSSHPRHLSFDLKQMATKKGVGFCRLLCHLLYCPLNETRVLCSCLAFRPYFALPTEPNISNFSLTVSLMAAAPGANSLRGSKPLPC